MLRYSLIFLLLITGTTVLAQGIVVLSPREPLQPLIDSIQTGSVIVLGKGIWRENISIDKDLVIVGEGAVIEGRETDRAVVEVRGEAAVTLIGLTLRGAYASRDCPTYRLPCGAGVGALEDAEVTLIGCELTGNERGLAALGRARVTLVRCSVHGNREDGILTRGEATLEGVNTVFGPGNRHGIWAMDASCVRLHKCAFAVDPLGIWLWEEATAVLHDCRFQGKGKEGIAFWADFDSRFILIEVSIQGYGVGIVVGDMAVGVLRRVRVEGCNLGIAEHTCYCGFGFAPCAYYGELHGEATLAGNEHDLCPLKGWKELRITPPE